MSVHTNSQTKHNLYYSPFIKVFLTPVICCG